MMTPQGLSGFIARFSDLAGIDRIRLHRLRHTAGMDVLAPGGSLAKAKDLLGHAYAVTTMTYAIWHRYASWLSRSGRCHDDATGNNHLAGADVA